MVEAVAGDVEGAGVILPRPGTARSSGRALVNRVDDDRLIAVLALEDGHGRPPRIALEGLEASQRTDGLQLEAASSEFLDLLRVAHVHPDAVLVPHDRPPQPISRTAPSLGPTRRNRAATR